MVPPIDIVLLEKDGETFHFIVRIGHQSVEVITELSVEGDVLVADHLHIEGPGTGLISPAALRDAARKLALSWGTRAIRIHGGIRTTGAAPGHRPRPLLIEAVPGSHSP